MSDPYDKPHDRDGSGRTIAIIVLVALVALAAAWAAGLLNINASGKLEAPKISVEGGSIPKVDVQAADINVGTRKETVEVPTVTVDKPGDDGKKNR